MGHAPSRRRCLFSESGASQQRATGSQFINSFFDGTGCHSLASMGQVPRGTRGQLLAPFLVQAHHGLVDGFHIGQLARPIAVEPAVLMATREK